MTLGIVAFIAFIFGGLVGYSAGCSAQDDAEENKNLTMERAKITFGVHG